MGSTAAHLYEQALEDLRMAIARPYGMWGAMFDVAGVLGEAIMKIVFQNWHSLVETD